MLKVALVGATGAVGQEFVIALNRHPWFELDLIVSSERTAGKKYIDALRDPNTAILRWHNKEEVPEFAKDMVLSNINELDPGKYDLIFAALRIRGCKANRAEVSSHMSL